MCYSLLQVRLNFIDRIFQESGRGTVLKRSLPSVRWKLTIFLVRYVTQIGTASLGLTRKNTAFLSNFEPGEAANTVYIWIKPHSSNDHAHQIIHSV